MINRIGEVRIGTRFQNVSTGTNDGKEIKSRLSTTNAMDVKRGVYKGAFALWMFH